VFHEIERAAQPGLQARSCGCARAPGKERIRARFPSPFLPVPSLPFRRFAPCWSQIPTDRRGFLNPIGADQSFQAVWAKDLSLTMAVLPQSAALTNLSSSRKQNTRQARPRTCREEDGEGTGAGRVGVCVCIVKRTFLGRRRLLTTKAFSPCSKSHPRPIPRPAPRPTSRRRNKYEDWGGRCTGLGVCACLCVTLCERSLGTGGAEVEEK